MNLKGTKTEANLKAAFAGESQARNKYTYFANQAKKDGHDAIAAFFEEAAHNEQHHAEMWYKFFNEGIDDTPENLQIAMKGEADEAGDMYPGFAATAKAEGFDDIAQLFLQVAEIEKGHEAKFTAFYHELTGKEAPACACAPAAKAWKCDRCGYVAYADTPPRNCPVCGSVAGYSVSHFTQIS